MILSLSFPVAHLAPVVKSCRGISYLPCCIQLAIYISSMASYSYSYVAINYSQLKLSSCTFRQPPQLQNHAGVLATYHAAYN